MKTTVLIVMLTVMSAGGFAATQTGQATSKTPTTTQSSASAAGAAGAQTAQSGSDAASSDAAAAPTPTIGQAAGNVIDGVQKMAHIIKIQFK